MRIACGLALAALALLAGPANAQAPRVLLAFLPAESDHGLLERLDAVGAVAITSPTVGGYSPVQTYLDVGQGSRVSTRVYDDPVPELRLLPSGRVAGWPAAVARARDAPGDVVPGLLGETVRRAGGRVAYAGVAGLTHDEAAAAADRAGRLDTVSLGSPASLSRRLAALLRDHELVVARLPARGGLRVLERLAGEPFVLVVRAPVPGPLEQLPTAATLGGRGEGVLTSRTTRLPGMVAASDYAPTILAKLGLDAPDAMDGRPIEAEAGSWRDAQSLADRLAHIKGRRGPVLRLALAAWLFTLGVLAAADRIRRAGRPRGSGLRRGLRLGLLAAMWLPGVALVTGAIDPSRTAETGALALVPLALAFGTDRLVPWPRAPAVPAAAVIGAHAIDLALGSPLTVRSLAGPNPGFGARFYGVGNELEAILAVTVLLGTGALMAQTRARAAAGEAEPAGFAPAARRLPAVPGAFAPAARRLPAVPAGFALACLVACVFVGAGRLGADVGGVITLGAGGAAAVLASLPGGPSRRAVALAVVTPVAAVGGLAVLDAVTGGDAHLTRSVVDAGSPGELVDIAQRRFEVSWQSLKQGTTPISVGLLAALLAYGMARRERVLAPLGSDRAFAAGMWGALAATLAGALANDSGPTIFLVGAAALLLAAAYLAGRPLEGGLT